jgi:hypothetical protein
MRKIIRSLALSAALLLGTSVAFASPAFADCGSMREFSGLVQSMKKGNKGGFVIDNRMGDKVKFNKAEENTVEDERPGDKKKAKWDDLANGDYVSVCWKMMDKPRKAYKVIVKPAPAEAGEEE